MRKMMLEGKKPAECGYCWKVEGIGRNNISDRINKSIIYKAEDIKKIQEMNWADDVNLKTLEISFDRQCNFACSYCNAGYSTTWSYDIAKNGPYQNFIAEGGGGGAYQTDGAWSTAYGKHLDDNPYVDKKDQIPCDPVRPLPKRSVDLPDEGSLVHFFGATNMPHPLDPQSDKKVGINFKKYDNGAITYQVMGPLEQVPVGQKVNKYGQTIPEKYSWIDPRTEELLMRRPDGTFTEKGRGLYSYLVGEKGGGVWSLIDRNITSISQKNIADPWA
jgi:hypothetical protein